MGILHGLSKQPIQNFMDKESSENKIDDLNKEAWEVRVSDSNRAHLLSGEAVKLAGETGYTKGEAEGLRTLGFTYIRLSKHNEARKLLDESFKLFQTLNDLRGQSDIYEYYGIIERSFGNYKKSLEFLFKALEIRQQTKYRDGESLSYYHLGVTYRYIGNLEQALEYFLKSLTIAREINYWIAESYSLNNIGSIYFELNDNANALEYYNQSLAIRKESGDKWGEAGCLDNIGYIYFKTGEYNKAKEFCEKSFTISNSVGDKKGEANALFHLAEINHSNKNSDEAIASAAKALELRRQMKDKKGQSEVNIFLAELHESDLKDCLNFLTNALELAEELKALDLLYKIHHALYKVFKQLNKNAEALVHLELSNAFEKEIHSSAINQKILNLEITHHVETSKKEAEIFRLRNIELVNLYEEIKKQKEEIEAQKKNLEETLAELKATQAQLIQSEKMASLGELTAGIAHEIQNPLNFVNNFSDVNAELIDELTGERQKAKSVRNEEVENEILNDIQQNLEKILHHGKRADAIVKSMLQHSRVSTGKKEPTDINALCDEYLRLSYHGTRAKDKSFNAIIKTGFDENIGKINVVPQDIGRVLLNLFNNAFYAVNEKRKNPVGLETYEPTILVKTKEINDKIEIKVSDNGIGIPQKVIDKIFQPFFTTKPTGQGTGLGLSLSYDIIKAHGGEIKVETKEGEGAEFIIQLPINE